MRWPLTGALTVALLSACCSAPAPPPSMADRAAAWDQLPAAQRQWLLDHPDAAAGMGGLSEEERAWIREHPDAARTLGEMKPEARDELLERYQSLPPDVQRRLRESPEGYLR